MVLDLFGTLVYAARRRRAWPPSSPSAALGFNHTDWPGPTLDVEDVAAYLAERT